eukprot:SAG11_NODE_27663_length_330_cov_1.064935_1_plen_25_part_01
MRKRFTSLDVLDQKPRANTMIKIDC